MANFEHDLSTISLNITVGSHISYKDSDDVIYNVNHESMGNKAIIFHGTNGVQVGWLASQEDMLADDWEVFK